MIFQPFSQFLLYIYSDKQRRKSLTSNALVYEHADQLMCPVNIVIFRNQASLWTRTFDLSFKSCCRLLMSESTTADVCCFLFSNCSSKSRICARHFLFSLSRASFSVSNLSLFPHSSAFSLWSRSSCKK